jgi:PAS domain S-box-containing protein
MAAVHPLQGIDELRAAQARLRALIDNEPECVKLLDAEGRLLEMNAAGLRMIEADSAAEVLGKCVYGIVAPEHAAAFRALTERVCRGERATLEFELVGLKGTRRWMETHAVPFDDETAGETRLLAITRDITDRKKAELALRESESRFHSFMQHVPAAAWIKDAHFRYTYVNRTYESVYGRAASEVLGRDDFALHPAERARFLRNEDEAIARSGEAAAHRLHAMPYADGRPGHWLIVKFPLADAAGKAGVAGFAVDVTARMEAEEKARRYAQEVRELLKRLVQAQEAERRRVAGELHDLIGQNLTALGIDLQALKERLRASGDEISAPRLDAMALLLETTIDAIRGVMTDLRPAALEEFGLVPALRWYASQFGQRTGMQVSLQVEGREARLPADAELALFRIAQEALTNAAKHSGGRSVELRIGYGATLSLSVQDDGRGSPDAERRRGFGLNTMRERAEAHGGRLHVESSLRGTRLVAEIPLPAHGD